MLVSSAFTFLLSLLRENHVLSAALHLTSLFSQTSPDSVSVHRNTGMLPGLPHIYMTLGNLNLVSDLRTSTLPSE